METAGEPRKTILVVEDEGLIADDVRRRLERMGYSVPAIVNSGEEAVRQARAREFDLVLMDIRLKGQMNGIEAAQILRRESRAPVVYLTAHADQDTVSSATLTEPFGYILKPISDNNLRTVVQIALYKHEMERRLRASEAWLATTLRSIGEGIAATDPDGKIVFLNAAAEQATGWSATEAVGRPFTEVISLRAEDTGELAPSPVLDLFPGETRCYRLAPRAGEPLPVELQCFENQDASGSLGAILVLRDIRARREWEALLVQSQRMEAVGSLAGGIAREFAELLAGIDSQLDDLADRAQAEPLRTVLARAAATVGQLSALSRLDPACCEAIDVNLEIQRFQDSLALCLGPAIALETALHPNSGFIHADRNRFQQMLLNLALHARRAMPESGRWRIESSVLDLDPADPLARRSGHPWLVRLRFICAGGRIAAGPALALFEPDFSGAAGPGRFSLATAHAVATQHGGQIAACAENGIEILWPCIGTVQGMVGLVGRHRPADTVPSVLLIEEEDTLRRAMWSSLDQDGYQVLAAKTAACAESIAAAYGRPIASLIGDAACFALVERFRIPAYLCLGGYRHQQAPEASVLSKPFPIEEFRRRIHALERAS